MCSDREGSDTPDRPESHRSSAAADPGPAIAEIGAHISDLAYSRCLFRANVEPRQRNFADVL